MNLYSLWFKQVPVPANLRADPFVGESDTQIMVWFSQTAEVQCDLKKHFLFMDKFRKSEISLNVPCGNALRKQRGICGLTCMTSAFQRITFGGRMGAQLNILG